MSRLATSFVLGYHGCDRAIGKRAIDGDLDLIQSRRDFDWLGPGAYFWESDPHRALQWAKWKADQGRYSHPYVIGAVIDLGNCLDLTSQEDLALLTEAHKSFVQIRAKADLPLPENLNAPGDPNGDRVLRYLDCAVIRHLHEIMAGEEARQQGIEPFDTVRGMFTEGGALYPGAGFQTKTHVQIAVIDPKRIKGVFQPRPYPAL